MIQLIRGVSHVVCILNSVIWNINLEQKKSNSVVVARAPTTAVFKVKSELLQIEGPIIF